MQKFTRDQLVFIVDRVFMSVFDRVESSLPCYASIKEELDSFIRNESEIRDLIDGYVMVAAAMLPVLYAGLTDDGMGIGEFVQFNEFEDLVKYFVERKIDPILNCPGRNVVPPDTKRLAEDFVDSYFSDYLKE